MYRFAMKIFAVLGAVVGFIFFGYSKGKTQAKDEQNRKDIETLSDEVKASAEVADIAKNQQRETQAIESKHAGEREQVVAEAKETKTFDFGKWVLILFFIVPFTASCTPKEITVYKTVVPSLPLLKTYERPEYSASPFSVIDGQVCMTESQISDLFEYVMKLKEIIKNYESQVGSVNSYYDQVEQIYKE